MTSGKRHKAPGQCDQIDFASRSPDSESQDRFWRNVFRSAIGSRLQRTTGQLSTPRSWLLAGIHLLIFAVAYWSAFALRLDLPLPKDDAIMFWSSVGWVIGIQLLVFCLLGQFQGWWQYVTFSDLANLLLSATISFFALATVNLFVFLPHPIPRVVLIIDCILMVGMLGAVRASWRMFREVFRPMLNGKDCRWALLVGTDLSNGILAHQIQSQFQLPYRVRGFLSTDDAAAGTHLGQIPILGKLEDVREIAAAYRATDVLVVAGTLPGQRLRDSDGGLRTGRLEPEDHPLLGGPPGRRRPRSHPRHRNQRPLGPRSRDPGHGEHRQAARRAARHGHRRRRQHRLGNLPPDHRLPSANPWSSSAAARTASSPSRGNSATCTPPTALLSLHRRRDQSGADGADLQGRIVPKSSSTPPPTSTCR